MSWKNRNYPTIVQQHIGINTKIISHSISPHKENFHVQQTRHYTHHVNHDGHNYGFLSKHWDKNQCLVEIEILKSKGYVPGRGVITAYNNPGRIKKFRDIPDTGMDFSGKYPNIIVIERDKMPGMDNLYFNEEELTLLPEASNDC